MDQSIPQGHVVTITPFEEQVLTALYAADRALVEGKLAEHIEGHGRMSCGYPYGWGGPPQDRLNLDYRTYPNINLALGRLAKKGLVWRQDSIYLCDYGYTAGEWELTNQGKLLLGIE